MASVDRLSLTLIALLCISGTAVGTYMFAPSAFGGSAEAAPSPDGSAGDDSSEAETPEWIVDNESCDNFQDPHDPRRDKDAGTAQDDEIVDLAVNQPEKVREFITMCNEQARKAGATAAAYRVSYAAARFELAMSRRDDALQHLRAIAPHYPAAAWKLADTLTGGEAPTTDSFMFEEIMGLLMDAHRGGETRGDTNLKQMVQMIIPVDRLEMPSLVAAVYFGKNIPDSTSARMALLSFYDHYADYCTKWEMFTISPADQAEINNARVALQVDSYVKAVKSLPAWSENVRKWADNLGGNTLEGIIQDFNSGVAAPQQVLFLVNTAAARDGWRQAETMKCTGPRASRLIGNLIRILRERRAMKPSAPKDSDLDALAARPDVLSMI